MATPEALERLLALQELDTRIDQLRHRHATLPERDALAAAQAAVDRLDAEMAGVQSRHDDLLRSQRRLEDEVASVEAKAAEVDRKLYGGTVTAPRELQDMQAEVESLRRRQSSLEDELIEVMELAEPVGDQLARMGADRERLTSEVEEQRRALTAAEAEVDAELAGVEVERAGVAAEVPADLLATYDRLRTRLDGVAVARLEGSRCLGCHLTLPATELDQIRRQDAGAVVTHEECGRILVR